MSRISDFFSRLLSRKVPASVFVTMNPQMQAVRIAVRENGRQSFEYYVREQVAACSRSSVVPDHTLLHLTFPDSKAIPSRRGTTNEYFYGKLAPAFIRQNIHPEPAVSLRDAAFALSKGLSPLLSAGRREQLMRDPEYRRFSTHCARASPDDAPLYRAVSSSLGTYLFSDTPKGRRAMYCYMQYMTDRFFEMRADADTLKIYELKHLPARIAAMADNGIDKFVKSDLKSDYPGLERSRYSFTEEKRIPTSILAEGVCSAAYSISPRYEDFSRFVAENRTQVSSENHDLATLSYIAENGYAAHIAEDGLHRFRHREFFAEVASKLRDCDRARMGSRQSTHDFGYGALQQQAREIAAGILRTQYNIQNGRFLTEHKESLPDAKQHVSLPGTGTAAERRKTERRLRHSRYASGKRASIKM